MGNDNRPQDVTERAVLTTDAIRNKLTPILGELDMAIDNSIPFDRVQATYHVRNARVAAIALRDACAAVEAAAKKNPPPCLCTRCEAERFEGWAKRIRDWTGPVRTKEDDERRETMIGELRDSIAIRWPRGLIADLCAALEALNAGEAESDDDASTLLEEMAYAERESLRLNPGLELHEGCEARGIAPRPEIDPATGKVVTCACGKPATVETACGTALCGDCASGLDRGDVEVGGEGGDA